MGSFWGGAAGRFLILAVAFSAVYLVATMLLGARARGRRERELATRIGGRGEGTPASEAVQSQWLPGSFVDAGTRFAEATGFNAGLDERLEQAGMPVLAGEFVALIVVCALLGAVFGALLLQNIVFVLLVAGIAALIPYVWMLRNHRKRQQALLDQLADTLSILASSLRAGYSFLQALDTVSKEIGEPSASEFQRVVAEIRLGRPIDDALTAMAVRVGSDDLKWAVIAINVQRNVGGNLAEVLDIVANTVRERGYIRRQVQVLSAEGRLSVAILSALPFLILLYLAIVNPEYITPLFTTTTGIILLVAAGSMMGAGIFVMSRMVKIDV
ncbi:MAG: type II secretion system F family protein [Actinomycetota bacterium]